MIIKMLCTFEYDPETNSYTPVGDPEIVKTSKVKPKKDESSEPELTLDENKYSLNSAAIELLGIEPGDKVDIKYQLVDDISYPIIGPSSIWNSNSGNKLTKSGTVSYKGKQSILLSEYGNLFTFTPWKGHEGLFVLIGDEPLPEKAKEEKIEEDDNIEVPVTSEIEQDMGKKSDDLDDLLDLEDDVKEDTELKEFKFKF